MQPKMHFMVIQLRMSPRWLVSLGILLMAPVALRVLTIKVTNSECHEDALIYLAPLAGKSIRSDETIVQAWWILLYSECNGRVDALYTFAVGDAMTLASLVAICFIGLMTLAMRWGNLRRHIEGLVRVGRHSARKPGRDD